MWLRNRPKVITSTATVRRAAAQVSALFNRQVRVFQPPGLEAGGDFFSREPQVSEAAPGRLYGGVCAPGRRLVDDDVRSRLTQVDARGLKKRNPRLPHAVEELTSRKSTTEIPEVLERMKCQFPPPGQQAPKPPIDVLLATNVLSVGVDVGRPYRCVL